MAVSLNILGSDTIVAKDYKSLYNIVQLADVTRPGTRGE